MDLVQVTLTHRVVSSFESDNPDGFQGLKDLGASVAPSLQVVAIQTDVDENNNNDGTSQVDVALHEQVIIEVSSSAKLLTFDPNMHGL
jgi:predicted transcriptional regulator